MCSDFSRRSFHLFSGLMSCLFIVLGFCTPAQAYQVAQNSRISSIECAANTKPLPVNNQAVLAWKASSPNQFRDRAHIEGVLVQTYADHSGHHHYKVQIGQSNSETVEVIYNESFGQVPAANPGAHFEACGDYITSILPAGGYPASPDGAIIHWVHLSPKPNSHESGFMIIDGKLYGMQNENGSQNRHRKF